MNLQPMQVRFSPYLNTVHWQVVQHHDHPTVQPHSLVPAVYVAQHHQLSFWTRYSQLGHVWKQGRLSLLKENTRNV